MLVLSLPCLWIPSLYFTLHCPLYSFGFVCIRGWMSWAFKWALTEYPSTEVSPQKTFSNSRQKEWFMSWFFVLLLKGMKWRFNGRTFIMSRGACSSFLNFVHPKHNCLLNPSSSAALFFSNFLFAKGTSFHEDEVQELKAHSSGKTSFHFHCFTKFILYNCFSEWTLFSFFLRIAID